MFQEKLHDIFHDNIRTLVMFSWKHNNAASLLPYLTCKSLYRQLHRGLCQPIPALQEHIRSPRRTMVCLNECCFCEKKDAVDNLMNTLCTWEDVPKGMYVHCKRARCWILSFQSLFRTTMDMDSDKVSIVPIEWMSLSLRNSMFLSDEKIKLRRSSGELSLGYIACSITYVCINPHNGVLLYTAFSEDYKEYSKWINIHTLLKYNPENTFIENLTQMFQSSDTLFDFDPYTREQRQYFVEIAQIH